MDSIFLKSYYNHSLGILRRITQMLTLFFFFNLIRSAK
jgi:hypothetical protein